MTDAVAGVEAVSEEMILPVSAHNYDYDVLVIGCGPAGQKAAIKCAKVGRKVAIIDERQVVGGQCLHIGTIPSKTLRWAIIYLSGFYERQVYGETYRVKDDITAQDLIYRCKSIIRREIDIIHNQLTRNGVEVLQGTARFVDAHRVRLTTSIGTEELSAQYFIVATGSRSYLHYELPFDNYSVMNTDDILSLQYIPKKMAIIGGGIIGMEYASMFALLDMEVHLISKYEKVLPFVDQHLVQVLRDFMESHNVHFHLNCNVEAAHIRGPKSVELELDSGATLELEMVLYAAQRWGNTRELHVENAGIELDERDYIKVNARYETSAPHIYAAGDVIGFPSLASTSIDQGRKSANALLGVPDIPYQPLFPYGIYTFPDISIIGLSEQQCKEQDRQYEIGIGYYKDTARGQILGDTFGLLKMIFDPNDRKILGVHIIGAESTELIHIGQAVMLHEGRLDYFLDSVFNYPTLAEVYKIAALNGFNKLKAAQPGGETGVEVAHH